MKIHVKSNFVVPGLEHDDSVELNRVEISLREFLDEISMMSPNRIDYVRPGAKTLNPDDWEVDINGIPYDHFRDGLETPLRDGDTVMIRIIPFGGG